MTAEIATASVDVTLKFNIDAASIAASLADALRKAADELAPATDQAPQAESAPARYVLAVDNEGDYAVVDRETREALDFYSNAGVATDWARRFNEGEDRTSSPKHWVSLDDAYPPYRVSTGPGEIIK